VTSTLLNCLAGKTQDRSGKTDVMSNKGAVTNVDIGKGKIRMKYVRVKRKSSLLLKKCYRIKNQMGKTNIGQPAQSILLDVNIYRLATGYIGVSIYEVFLQD
jgi:hypothetical protein